MKFRGFLAAVCFVFLADGTLIENRADDTKTFFCSKIEPEEQTEAPRELNKCEKQLEEEYKPKLEEVKKTNECPDDEWDMFYYINGGHFPIDGDTTCNNTRKRCIPGGAPVKFEKCSEPGFIQIPLRYKYKYTPFCVKFLGKESIPCRDGYLVCPFKGENNGDSTTYEIEYYPMEDPKKLNTTQLYCTTDCNPEFSKI